jgi:hypothetical protein
MKIYFVQVKFNKQWRTITAFDTLVEAQEWANQLIIPYRIKNGQDKVVDYYKY